MKLLSRKKSATASPKASKGKSFRRSITPKKKRNDDDEGETTKPRSRSRSLSRRFSMRSSRKSKQKTSPPELIPPVAVDEADAHQEPEAEKEAEATKEEEAPEEETLKEEAPEVESAKEEEKVQAIQEEEEGAEPAEEGAKEEEAKDEGVKEKEVQETSEADEPGKSHGFFKKMSFRKSKRGGSSRGSPVSYASSQGSAARATPPLEAPQEAMQEEADGVAAEEVEEGAKPEEDEGKEEEAALAEEGEAASTKEEEEEEQDEAAEGGEDAASAMEEVEEKEEEESASANEEEEVAPTAEEASLEEEAPKEKSRALAKEETETVDDYSYDQDLSMEPSIEAVEDKDTVVLGFFQAAPPQPRGEESVFDVGMHNVKLIVDGAMAQAMNLGAQGSELLGCCANTAVEDDNENNPASDIVATEEDSKTRGATTPADPNQSIFLQPELLGKAKDMWEQARTKVEETYTEASSSWMDSNTFSTLENKAANQGPSLPVGCITEETEETDDTREESEDPSFSVNDEGIRQGS